MLERPDNLAVLIVEDDPLVRIVAQDARPEAGVATYAAEDAKEGLSLLETEPSIAVLFTDINTPGPIDGLELARRAHALRPKLELIVTSGREALKDGDLPDHGTFLPKPYPTSRLLKLVDQKILSRASHG